MELAQLLPPQTLDSDPVLEFDADLEEAAHALDLEPWVLQRLKHPEREITLNLPLIRDDGSAVNVTGYRIQHNRAHGPCIGPVVLSPSAHPTLLRTIAAEITLQSALLGLRLGGAAAAIVVDPDQLSERELRHVIKDFVSALHENSGPLRDVLACDGNDYIAIWMDEANTRAHGQSEPAAIAGKPIEGGSLDVAWARSVSALAQHALGVDTLKDFRIAIQGFGGHGRALVQALHLQQAKIVAIADRSGGISREAGIEVTALQEYVQQNGVLFGFPAADAVTNSDVLECDCNLLILAAAPGQIRAPNAARVRGRMILEVRQGAVTESGEAALPDSCLVVPHLLAAATKLAIWSHEWQRGLTYSAPDPWQAETDASALAIEAFDRAQHRASDNDISLRHASLILALSRLASSLRRR
jgi:glutamate dehydrogenase/leucine dehydrogenase